MRAQSDSAVVVEKWRGTQQAGKARRRSRREATGEEWWAGKWKCDMQEGVRVPIAQVFPVDCEETQVTGEWKVTDSVGWMHEWDAFVEEETRLTECARRPPLRLARFAPQDLPETLPVTGSGAPSRSQEPPSERIPATDPQ